MKDEEPKGELVGVDKAKFKLIADLRKIADDEDLLEVARRKIEINLVEMRDSRISVLGRNNGLVIRERDGTNSHIIRLPVEVAVRLALLAIAESLGGGDPPAYDND